MGVTTFLKEYMVWHYGEALRDLWELEKNFLWFGYHFFSIPLLFRTLFSPFYRIHESYKGWTTIEMLLENAVANIVSRVVGFFFRTFVIICGLVCGGVVVLCSVPVLALWFLFPVVLGGLVVLGTSFFF